MPRSRALHLGTTGILAENAKCFGVAGTALCIVGRLAAWHLPTRCQEYDHTQHCDDPECLQTWSNAFQGRGGGGGDTKKKNSPF